MRRVVMDKYYTGNAVSAHSYAETWSSDENGHWHECTICGGKKDEASHTPDRAEATETDPVKCSDCGFILAAAQSHTHSLTKVEAKDATCAEDGNKEYYRCDICGKRISVCPAQ